MLAEFSIIPVGEGESLSGLVSLAVEIVHNSGLEYRVNPMGTVVEGDWDEVMGLIRRCHEAVRKEGCRVVTTITIDDRSDSGSRIGRKLQSLEDTIGHALKK
ncbi:MAG: MTH1187 family thiamine-binding protein [bacterium]